MKKRNLLPDFEISDFILARMKRKQMPLQRKKVPLSKFTYPLNQDDVEIRADDSEELKK
jgi:hypothetical protein